MAVPVIDSCLMTVQFRSERCLIISVIAFWRKDKEAAQLRDKDADIDAYLGESIKWINIAFYIPNLIPHTRTT